MSIQSVLQSIYKTRKGYKVFSYFGWHLRLLTNSHVVSNSCDQSNRQNNSVTETYFNVSRKYCSQTSIQSQKEKVVKNSGEIKNGFGHLKIEELKTSLCQSVKFMFLKSYDYNLIHKDVVLESNFFGTNRISRGVFSYALEILKIRFYLHYRYPDVSVSVKEACLIESDNLIIRVYWKLSAIPQKHVVKFWRFLKKQDSILDSDFKNIDGISDFHIGNDGLVHRHKLDMVK